MNNCTKFFIYFYLWANLHSYIASDENDTWAILISTMDMYGGCGLEAATYKTYQLLRKRGVPAKQIIVFSHDVCSFSSYNPFRPAVYFAADNITLDTENVYEDIRLDYVAENNTAENFLAVLSGNKKAVTSGSGRVLESGPYSTVLIYYTGWSYFGSIIFPEGYYDIEVYGDEFGSVIDNLYDEGKYDKILLVFDCPYSASVFDNYVDSNERMVAVASQGIWDHHFKICVRNEILHLYTAPCFTYYWITYLEQNPRLKLIDAYNWVKNGVNEPGMNLYVPQLYGQLDLTRQPLNAFYGDERPSQSEPIVSNPNPEPNTKTLRTILETNQHVVRGSETLDVEKRLSERQRIRFKF